MTMAIWKKETGEMLFFEPKDYYALVDLKTLRMMHVLEISSENDVNRLIDGKKNFVGGRWRKFCRFCIYTPRHAQAGARYSFREMDTRKCAWFLGNINELRSVI